MAVMSCSSESPLRGDAHGGFGGRVAETGWPQSQHGGAARPLHLPMDVRSYAHSSGVLFYNESGTNRGRLPGHLRGGVSGWGVPQHDVKRPARITSS